MLNKPTIKMLDEDKQRLVEDALITLYEMGVFPLQIEQSNLAISQRFDRESPEELAVQIVEQRVSNRVLKGLHDLGEQMKREKK